VQLLKFGFALGPTLAMVAFLEVIVREYTPAGRAIQIVSTMAILGAIALALMISRSKKWLSVPIGPAWSALQSVPLALFAVIVPYAPSFVAVVRMLGSEFPKSFYSVDTPYHLSQVFSLLHGTGYPPASLNNLGAVFNYHYGSQLLSASISTSTGILAHNSYLLITPIVFLFSALCGLVILGSVQNSWQKKLILLFPLLCELSFLGFNGSSLSYITSIEGIRGGFPHISITAATCLILFLLICFELSTKSVITFGAILFIPALIVLFKSPFIFSVVGFVVGYIVRLALLRELRWKHFAIACFSALLTLITIPLVSMGANSFEFRGLFGGLRLSFITTTQWLIVIFVPFGLLTYGRFRAACIDVFPHILACFIPVSLYLSYFLKIDGTIDNNLYQVTFPCSLIAFFALFRSINVGDITTIYSRTATVLFIAGACLPMIINRAHNLVSVINQPIAWHEYVDNQKLGECLKVVPVQGSILVTNDLRYPAENFARANLQMQIPALFGHQMFAGNLPYEKRFLNPEYFRAQEVLVSGTVDTIVRNAKLFGWTHVVLFKRTSSVELPLKVICENSEVQIIKFPSESVRGD